MTGPGSSRRRPRVVLLRGYNANPWELRPWGELSDEFDVRCLVTGVNRFETAALPVPAQAIRSLGERVPRSRIARLGLTAVGDRYLALDEALAGADIVHAAETFTWFSAQAAGLRPRLGFRLALTVWETIPMRAPGRWDHVEQYRAAVLSETDVYLATTERARRALLLEGVGEDQIRVVAPGIDLARFSTGPPDGGVPARSERHLILSPGRLVWEKGHQDAIRAVAALHRGLLGSAPAVTLVIVGSGPEEGRLRALARSLGLGPQDIEFRPQVPYEQMPGLYHDASAMVLASLQHPLGWEEQFGMVLAEALASSTPIIAARSGAIPEVVGDPNCLFDPGDWWSLAEMLLHGPLSRPPGTRAAPDPERVAEFSSARTAERLRSVYRELLGFGGG